MFATCNALCQKMEVWLLAIESLVIQGTLFLSETQAIHLYKFVCSSAIHLRQPAGFMLLIRLFVSSGFFR